MAIILGLQPFDSIVPTITPGAADPCEYYRLFFFPDANTQNLTWALDLSQILVSQL
jgi:hypothetical protein